MHHTLIAGIGNVLMGDDAIGPTVVEWLRARYEFPREVKAVDLGTPGVDLALHMVGVRTVVIIDAMDDASVPVATVRVFGNREILKREASAGLDPHAPGLREALALAKLSGRAPRRVRLIGVAVENCAMGRGLSAAVGAAVPSVVELVAGELRKLGIRFTERSDAGKPYLWWEASRAEARADREDR